MDTKIMVFPHRYVQGPVILSNITEHLLVLGIYRPLVLLDPSVIDVCREPIEKDPEILSEVTGFCKSVGLPTTLKDLGLTKISDQILRDLANAASKDPLIRSMPNASQAPDDNDRFYDPDNIFRALKKVEARSSVGHV